jgi:hypothetical protein
MQDGQTRIMGKHPCGTARIGTARTDDCGDDGESGRHHHGVEVAIAQGGLQCWVIVFQERRQQQQRWRVSALLLLLFSTTCLARVIGPPWRGDAPPPYSWPQPILPILVCAVGERHLGNGNNNKMTKHDNQQQNEMIMRLRPNGLCLSLLFVLGGKTDAFHPHSVGMSVAPSATIIE